MFRAEPPPIIRSSDCTYSFWYLSDFAATCCDHGWDGTGNQFHPNHDRKSFDKYQKLYVQSKLLMMGGGSIPNM
jgi:hypothetical protein